MKVSDPDVFMTLDGRFVVNAASLPLADRQGRRVIRCVELTPGEQDELRRRFAEIAADLLTGLPSAAKRGAQ